MPSRTSFSERAPYGTLRRKNVRRYWPVWCSHLVILLFILPLNLLTNGPRSARFSAEITPFALERALSRDILATVPVTIGFGFCLSLVCAMALFSYLYTARSTGFIHALPVRREGLFLTNYLTGLGFLWVPDLIAAALSVPVQLYLGGFSARGTLLWLLAAALSQLFFYSFAVFCAMFTGNLLALPVFYGILSFLSLIARWLIGLLARQFLYGYNVTSYFGERLATWLSPAFHMLTEVRRMDVPLPVSFTEYSYNYTLAGIPILLIYAAVGLLLAGWALVLYRRRQLECAGDLVTVGWARPLFVWGVGFFVGISNGVGTHIFLLGDLPETALSLLLFVLLWGAVGYLAATMLLEKTFRVFRTRWKGLAAFCAVIIALCIALDVDLIGYEHRIPDAAEVEEVQIAGLHSVPYDTGAWQALRLDDPDAIGAVRELHAACIAERPRILPAGNAVLVPDSVEEGEEIQYATFTITYTLRSGRTVSRRYSATLRESQLAESGSITARIAALFEFPAVREDLYFREIPENSVVSHAYISLGVRSDAPKEDPFAGLSDEEIQRLLAAGIFPDDYSYVTEDYSLHPVPVPEEYLPDLWNAIGLDIRDGALGCRSLFENEDSRRTATQNAMTIYFTDPVLPYGEVGDTFCIDISMQTTAQHTIGVLRRAGVLNDAQFLLSMENEPIR